MTSRTVINYYPINPIGTPCAMAFITVAVRIDGLEMEQETHWIEEFRGVSRPQLEWVGQCARKDLLSWHS